jgi:protein-tyrosine-phosphatase
LKDQTPSANETPSRARCNVLFVCLGNACRSPMAEAIARREAADVISPSSAGIAPLGFIVEDTKTTLERNGYSTEGLHSKAADAELWNSAQLVINMTGRPKNYAFYGFADHAKVEDWQVSDPYGADSAFYQKICEELQRRVRALADRLRRTVRDQPAKASGNS